jgi:HEAT repeat protein
VFAALLLVLAVALHFVWGRAMARIAARLGGPTPWAWLPLLNLLLPLRLAGRSLFWGLLYLVPAVNFVVWALAWAEVCARLGRPVSYALGMAVPGLNVAVLEELAGASRARAVALVAALAVGVAALGSAQRIDRQRGFRRQAAALQDPSPEARRRAVEAIGSAGAGGGDALGALAAALQDADPRVRAAAARVLHREAPGRLASLRSAQPTVSLLEEARGAQGLFPDAELVRALAAPGPPALPPLTAALRDGDPAVRWHAAAALMQLEGQGRAAVPGLLAAMDDEVWEVRNAAGRALEEVVAAADAPVLAAALADPSEETRYHAARALARLGPGAAAALPALVTALGDPDWEVRMESAWAVAAAGPRGRPALPALVANLGDAEPQVRASAAWTIAAVGTDAAALDALRRALGDADGEVRRAAAGALARAGAK